MATKKETLPAEVEAEVKTEVVSTIAELIENETAEDSEAKKNLRQTFRNYIKQNPAKAEAEKQDLLKQLNSIQ